jgi:hypothetical protein
MGFVLMETVKITPTWTAMLPMLLVLALEGETRTGREAARQELRRMAKLADWAVENYGKGQDNG